MQYLYSISVCFFRSFLNRKSLSFFLLHFFLSSASVFLGPYFYSPFLGLFFHCILRQSLFLSSDFQSIKNLGNFSFLILFILRVFLKGLYKIIGGIVDMKINIIKQETLVRKRLLQELGGIKVQCPKLQTMIKNGEKKVDWFAIFAKILLYITIFFEIIFEGNVQKMSIEDSSDFRVTNNNFSP